MDVPSDRSPADRISVLIADDHPTARRGVRDLVELDDRYAVIGEAGDGDSALQSALHTTPAVVILDLAMPGTPVLDVIHLIAVALPRTRVLVLTMQEAPGYPERCFAAGAHGYVLKDHADTTLIVALDTVMGGDVYLDPQLSKFRPPSS